MKYAIAKTYGLQTFQGTLSFVTKVTNSMSYFTTFAGNSILFDSVQDVLKFAKKKNIEVRDFYSRSHLYIQAIDEELISNKYQMKDTGHDNILVKWKQFQDENNQWKSETKQFVNGY